MVDLLVTAIFTIALLDLRGSSLIVELKMEVVQLN